MNLADGAPLDQDSIIYLDLKTHRVIQAQTFAYVEAWAAAVAANGKYRPGVYCGGLEPHGAAEPTCDTIRRHNQNPHNLAFSAARAAAARGERLSEGPLDANGDVTPLAFARPAGAWRWALPGYAEAWPFCQGWPTAGHVIYTNAGQQLQLKAIWEAFDFDIGRTADPSRTVGGKLKAQRRRTVASLTADAAAITSGSTATLTIKIDGPAAAPDGLLCLIRFSLPEVFIPTSVRVPAGQSENVHAVLRPRPGGAGHRNPVRTGPQPADGSTTEHPGDCNATGMTAGVSTESKPSTQTACPSRK